MRILIVIETFYPKLRGGEIVIWRFASALAKKGHDITVVTGRIEGTDNKEIINGIEIIRPIPLKVDGKSQSILMFLRKLLFLIQLYKYLNHYIKYKTPDIIYNQAYTVTYPATVLGRKYNVPVITSVGNFQGRDHFKTSNFLIAIIHIIKEQLIIRFCKQRGIRVASYGVANIISTVVNTKLYTIPTPVDDDEIKYALSSVNSQNIRYSLDINDDELFLLYVGALEKVKNIDSLIKSLSFLQKPFKFIIVGNGSEKKHIEKVIGEYGMEEKVSLVGSLPNNKVMQLMVASDALLLSSISETGPLVVFEALAAQTAVITTNVGSVKEIKAKNLSIIDSVKHLVPLVERGIHKTRDFDMLKKYSIENISLKFENMFFEVIDAKSEY